MGRVSFYSQRGCWHLFSHPLEDYHGIPVLWRASQRAYRALEAILVWRKEVGYGKAVSEIDTLERTK